jgi:chemotaxis signal transduction protein
MSPALPVDALQDEAEDAHRRLLLVSLQDAVVALPAEAVGEILPARPYASVPGAPAAVAGLVNRRGRILTVVDLGLALAMAPTASDDEHRVVVVSWQGREVGLAVRDVLQITSEWWNGEAAAGVGTDAEPSAAGDRPYDEAADEQLRVIELDAVFGPLFGGETREVGKPDSEKP